jgi:hypothetical protein
MPLVLSNRVQESATANTTVSFTLTGAVSGFQTFATIGNTNTTYYSATDASGNWEVGLGTYSTTGPTLTRTTVYASSNSGLAVTFSGAVNVFVTYPSGRSVNLNESGNVSALGIVSSGTWQGSTVGVAYGGTGVTTSSGINSVVLRDANENITVNRINQGLQNTTASGGITTLTAASDFNQLLTGTGNHTFRLPNATTLTDTTAFQFNNASTGTLTVQNNSGTAVGTITSGGAANAVLISNASVGGTWEFHGYLPEGVTWGTNALNLGSTVISNGTWQGGTIASAYGGTGLTTFTGANNALYSTSSSALAAGTLPLAAGGTGQTTQQAALNALSGTQTANRVLRSNGTNVTLSQVALATDVSGTLPVANGGTGQTTYTNGQLLIGNTTGNTLSKATLTAGANITITNGAGAITIAASSGGGGSPATPTVAGIVFGKTIEISGCNMGQVALGYNAGACNQQNNAVGIGYQAGFCTQSTGAVAVGYSAGAVTQGVNAVAVGYSAGNTNQSSYSVAIGDSSSNSCTCAGGNSVAIGAAASTTGACKAYQVAIGAYSSSNGYNGVAIGSGASANGNCSTAIGPGTTSAGGQTNRTYMGPIRNATATFTLRYNPTTREVTYF